MARMTGGQALVGSLVRHGVRVVFGVPGVQLYHATDALHGEPNVKFIATRHEQGAAYMAYGYSRAGGGIGTAMVVPGPGLLNATAAIGTAYSASCPILVVSGQIPKDLIGVNRGELHEVDDQLDCVRPITKWASRVVDPGEIPSAVQEAFLQLSTGRPRPVEIEMPMDTLAETTDLELLEPGIYERAAASQDSVIAGAKALAGSKRVVIWAGGGAISSGASAALERVAEYLQAPVVATHEGRGSISDRSYLSLGAPNFRPDPLDDYVARCDVVLAVGTRLARTAFADGQKIVQIDEDADEIGRNYSNTMGVQGDARRTLEELHGALASLGPARPSRRREFEAIRAARDDPSAQVEPQGSFVRAIRAAIPDNGILVADETQVGYYCRIFYPVYEPNTFITSSYFGNLGYAFPTALGVKVAHPDRAVVSISGDGGFLFNSQELATAAMYRINLVAVVFNDNAYGNVMRAQKQKFDGRIVGSKLQNPDFVKLAEAYGVRSVRAHGPEELSAAMKEALHVDAPSLIEVPVGMMPDPV